jgi:PAS domain S-box-containing protein
MQSMDQITPKYELASETKQFLREQAEDIVRGKAALSTQSLEVMAPDAVRALVHELQVHQIELEMQNETLRQTQLQLVAMQARYFDLYDLAPISYCTVNELGIILEANLATAEMLGEARGKLVGQRISRYIRKDFQDTYYLNRKLLMSAGARQCCELHMVRSDDSDFWVNASMSLAKSSNGDVMQRMVLTDVTNAKIMAMAMHASESRLRTLLDAIPSPLVLR